jgi:integrase
MRHVVKGQ